MLNGYKKKFQKVEKKFPIFFPKSEIINLIKKKIYGNK